LHINSRHTTLPVTERGGDSEGLGEPYDVGGAQGVTAPRRAQNSPQRESLRAVLSGRLLLGSSGHFALFYKHPCLIGQAMDEYLHPLEFSLEGMKDISPLLEFH